MPFVRIDVLAGRPPELLEELIAAVSETVARTLDVPIERVRVLINEVPPHLWGIGGVPASRVPGRAPASATGRAPSTVPDSVPAPPSASPPDAAPSRSQEEVPR